MALTACHLSRRNLESTSASHLSSREVVGEADISNVDLVGLDGVDAADEALDGAFGSGCEWIGGGRSAGVLGVDEREKERRLSKTEIRETEQSADGEGESEQRRAEQLSPLSKPHGASGAKTSLAGSRGMKGEHETGNLEPISEMTSNHMTSICNTSTSGSKTNPLKKELPERDETGTGERPAMASSVKGRQSKKRRERVGRVQ